MTAKEYAKELVDKYYYLFSIELENTIDYREAKECALIAIDELIKRENSLLGLSNKCSSTWYDMVKNQINLL